MSATGAHHHPIASPRKHRRWGGLVVTAVVAWAVYSGPALSSPAGSGGGGNTTTTQTTSTTHHETDIRHDLPNAQADATRVLGLLEPTFSPVVYDQTLPFPPNASEVSAAIAAAELAIQAAAAPRQVTITGPTFTQLPDDTSPSEMIANTSLGTNTTVTSTVSLGPGTILIGDDQSQTFFVAAGTTNVNTNTAFENFFQNNFQATTTHRALWQLTGLLAAASAPALSPIGLIGTGAGLVGFALWRLRRRRAAG